MTQRQSKIMPSTVGPEACEITLGCILQELADPKVTRRIMRRHQQLKVALDKLQILRRSDFGFFTAMAKLLYTDHRAKFELQKPYMPEKAYTHALACYAVLYRRAIKK